MSTTGSETIIRGSRNSERLIGILCIDLDPISRDKLEDLVPQTPGRPRGGQCGPPYQPEGS